MVLETCIIYLYNIVPCGCRQLAATLLAAADNSINQLLHADRYGFFDYFTCLRWIIKLSNYGLKA